jgi:PKD repeat protein
MMSVDPSDDQTFWYTTEFSNGGWNWRTQITSFGYVQEPVADFLADETLIPVGETINFTDKTSGIPTEWLWTFEGGTPGTSTDQNPENIQFDTDGTYDVTLTATNELGSNTIVKEDYITVSSTLLPEVDFIADKDVFCLGETIIFTDKTLYSPVQWQWDFNPSTVTFVDGTDATSQDPRVEFNEAGTYDVTLTSWNLNGEASLTKTEFLKAGGLVPFIEETFEEDGFRTNNWTIDNPDDDITWEIFEVGGTEPGTHAAGINFTEYFAVGERDRLISPPINLTGLSSASLNFMHAYAKRLLQVTDSLIIYVSDDCGDSWTRVLALGEDGNGSFATHEWTEEFWPEEESDWCIAGWGSRCYEVDLSEWAGSANIQIAFETYSYYGNPLFIDNIKISQYVGIDNEFAASEVTVYPNPNTGRFTVVIPEGQLYESLIVYNQIGQLVHSRKLNSQENLVDVQIDNEWQNGIYLIKLIDSNNQITTKKVIVNK